MLDIESGIASFDKDNGVWLKSDEMGIHDIHTLSPHRRFVNGNRIDDLNGLKDPKRIVIDFLLSTTNKGDPKDIYVQVFLAPEDFLPDEDPAEVISNLKLFDYNLANNSWEEIPNPNSVIFPNPIKLNGKIYLGYISANITVLGDPPIAVGR